MSLNHRLRTAAVALLFPFLLLQPGCAQSQASRQQEYAELASRGHVVRPSQSLELRNTTAQEQVRLSQRVVVARATGTEVKLGSDGNIYTYYHFENEETMKGRLGGKFSLRFLGGSLNGVEISSPIETDFQTGRTYVLFLGRDNQDGFPVLSPQHIYSVMTNPGDGARIVVPAPQGMTMYRKGTNRVASFSDRFAMLDDFRYSVGKVLTTVR